MKKTTGSGSLWINRFNGYEHWIKTNRNSRFYDIIMKHPSSRAAVPDGIKMQNSTFLKTSKTSQPLKSSLHESSALVLSVSGALGTTILFILSHYIN